MRFGTTLLPASILVVLAWVENDVTALQCNVTKTAPCANQLCQQYYNSGTKMAEMTGANIPAGGDRRWREQVFGLYSEGWCLNECEAGRKIETEDGRQLRCDYYNYLKTDKGAICEKRMLIGSTSTGVLEDFDRNHFDNDPVFLDANAVVLVAKSAEVDCYMYPDNCLDGLLYQGGTLSVKLTVQYLARPNDVPLRSELHCKVKCSRERRRQIKYPKPNGGCDFYNYVKTGKEMICDFRIKTDKFRDVIIAKFDPSVYTLRYPSYEPIEVKSGNADCIA